MRTRFVKNERVREMFSLIKCTCANIFDVELYFVRLRGRILHLDVGVVSAIRDGTTARSCTPLLATTSAFRRIAVSFANLAPRRNAENTL